MKLLFVATIITWLLPNLSEAETYWIPRTPLFDFLYQLATPISYISNTDDEQFLPVLERNSPTKQRLVRSKTGLYILIEGLGRVYKAMDTAKNQISFTRIDSTLYGGYNFYAFNFSFRDTLFSLGGYGYWRTNGQLRYFKEGDEWYISKINKEYRTGFMMMGYDQEIGKLYYYQPTLVNEVDYESGKDEPRYMPFIELDLNTRVNRVLGYMEKPFMPLYNSFINLPHLEGFLYFDKNDVFLIRYRDNKVLRLANLNIRDELLQSSTKTIRNSFEYEGKVYFNRYPDTALRDITISLSDFSTDYFPIYSSEKKSASSIYLYLFIILTSGTVLYFYWNNKRNRVAVELDTAANTFHEPAFTELEKSLLAHILNTRKKGNTANVEDINTILGLNRKSLEIQKKVRTENINRINHKYRVLTETRSDLIERIRSEEDRRFIQYSISDDNVLVLEGRSLLG